MRRSGTVLSAVFGACLVLGGCETGSKLGRVEVVYRFDNVRLTANADEWSKIRAILNRHTVKPVVGEVLRSSTTSGVMVQTVRAPAVLRSLRDLDAVQAELEGLESDRSSGMRARFSLSSVEIAYRSNVLAATVRVGVSGVAPPGFLVRVYTGPGAPAAEARAAGNGAWSAMLAVVPEARWVYASSSDPDGKLPTRFFRVDVNTGSQQDLDEAEFRTMLAAGSPSASGGAVSGPGEDAALRRAQDGAEAELRKKREQEEADIRLKRERDDQRFRGP